MDSLRKIVFQDWNSNSHDLKIRMVLFWWRFSQFLFRKYGDIFWTRIVRYPYKIVCHWILGIEIHEDVQISPGLVVFHGYGLVVNPDAVIGPNVELRQGVTIGSKVAGGCSPIIGANVSIGAGALILGEIVIGEGAIIAAGAVVVRDVPAFTVFAGNPARQIN